MKYKIVSLIGALVIAGCCVLSCVNPVAPETEPYNDVPYIEDRVIVVPEKVIVRAEIQRSKPDPQGLRSAMPCDMYDSNAFNTLDALDCVGEETENEQETGEEVVTEAPTDSGAVCDAVYCEPIPNTTAPETTWLAPSSEEIPHPAPVETTPQDKLLTALRNAGIEWWWPYAYAQVMQESQWNPNAVNANGLDFGLLQYRLKSPDGTRMYWTEPESIFDVDAQIRKYVGQVAARIAAGLSIEEIISRHFTSDYVTEINWEYVNRVLSWMK